MGHIDEIVQDAKSYIGQEEIQPNLGFKNPSFNAKMNDAGFYRSASWCGFFVIMVMKQVYNDGSGIWAMLSKYLSASTHTMWANFKAAPHIHTDQVPVLGAVVVWQEGNGTNGHTGIVVAVNGNKFTCVEGNSNSDGSRNGYEVAENTHTVGLPHSVNGLNLLGFGYMPD